MDLVYFSPPKFSTTDNFQEYPSVKNFYEIFRVINNSVMFCDRTGTITTPLKSHNLFPLGSHLTDQKETYANLMRKRAAEILAQGEREKRPLGIMWSGGIDSTALLIALLEVETDPGLRREKMHIFLSPESIQEFPQFYKAHISGKFKIIPSYYFYDHFAGEHIMVTGEGNDQLFGSDLNVSASNQLGPDFIKQPFTRDALANLLACYKMEPVALERFTELFVKLADRCPSGIETMFDFLWWLNFTCKWQSVYTRMLGYISPSQRSGLSRDFVSRYYSCFFFTEEFENWSIWNKHLKIGSDWRTYKLEAKKYILDFTGNQDYFENKVKMGSLSRILKLQRPIMGIDSEYRYHDHLKIEDLFVSRNDFV